MSIKWNEAIKRNGGWLYCYFAKIIENILKWVGKGVIKKRRMFIVYYGVPTFV